MIDLAGGTFTAMNKVRPGFYLRFQTAADNALNVGERGVVAICEPLSWGPIGTVQEITGSDGLSLVTGYDISAAQNRFLNEIFKGTNRTSGPSKILLYRPSANGSAQAAATIGDLTATAIYPGARGNDITVIITESVDTAGSFTVDTVVDGVIVDEQTVSGIAALVGNSWVTFSGDGDLTATTGTALTGGADGTVQTAAYSAFLSTIEAYKFDVLIYDGEDSTVAAAYAAFVARIAEEDGQYAQLVASRLTNPDSRFIVNVQSGVTLSDGTQLSASQVTWWAGGVLAGAQYNQSLTYAIYPDAVSASPVMTNGQIIAALNSGGFVLTAENGVVRVENDINSLVTFTQDIGSVYRYNKTIRLCNTIANDLYEQYAASYIGVVDNNEAGRTMFKAAVVGYLMEIQANNGIQNFTADDVTVTAGPDINSIIVTVALQVVGTVEKIYMTVEIS